MSQLEKAKAGVKLFLVSPEELSTLTSTEKAKYLYLLTSYLEDKREIEAMEEQKALVNYLDPEFGHGQFNKRIECAQEDMQQSIEWLDKLVKRMKRRHKGEIPEWIEPQDALIGLKGRPALDGKSLRG